MTNRPFNQLGHDESERLALLAEECAEVIQVVGKILRHGYASHHPNDPDYSNRDLLHKEMGDVVSALCIMVQAGDLNMDRVQKFSEEKTMKVGQYLHHNHLVDD